MDAVNIEHRLRHMYRILPKSNPQSMLREVETGKVWNCKTWGCLIKNKSAKVHTVAIKAYYDQPGNLLANGALVKLAGFTPFSVGKILIITIFKLRSYQLINTLGQLLIALSLIISFAIRLEVSFLKNSSCHFGNI